MKEYIKNILRADTPESSKRFTQLYSLLLMSLVIFIALIGVFLGKIESDIVSTILYILAGLVTGQSILTVVQNNTIAKSKKEGEPNYSQPTYGYDYKGVPTEKDTTTPNI